MVSFKPAIYFPWVGGGGLTVTGCPIINPFPLCIWVIMNCKIIQFHYKTIHFKADVLRTKTSTYSFLRYR